MGFIVEWQHALRRLRRSRAQTLAVVATLTLGIGANATMLGIVERLWLRAPPHVDEPDRIRRVLFGSSDAPSAIAVSSFPVYSALASDVKAFSGVAAYTPLTLSFGSGVDAYSIRAQLVSSSYFSVLGVREGLGRLSLPDAESGSAEGAVAVLGHAFWRRQFASDSAVIGRFVTIGGRQYQVIGVAPDGFTGVDIDRVEIFLPMSAAGEVNGQTDWRSSYASAWLRIVARLRGSLAEEVSAAQATAALRAANEQSGLPAAMLANSVSIASISAARGAERQFELKVSVALALVSLLVLVGACANVAFILFARAVEDRQEMAVHLALGAEPAGLVRVLLIETLALSVAGGLGGLATLHWAGGVVRTVLMPDVTWNTSAVDLRAIAMTSGLVIVATVLTGAARAMQFSRRDVASVLNRGDQHGARPRSVMRRSVLAAQTVMAMLAVTSAALVVQSLRNVRAIDAGLDIERVVYARMEIQALQTPELNALYERAAERMASLPYVEHVALFARSVPLVQANGISVRVPGMEPPPRIAGTGPYYSAASPSFLRTLGTKLLNGDDFNTTALKGVSRIALINETMSKRWWRGASPMGQCLKLGNDTTCTTIIGVVENIIKFRLLGDPEPQMVYVPLTHPFVIRRPIEAVLVRTSNRARARASELRRVMVGLVPRHAQVTVESYEETVDPQVRPWRLGAAVLSWFGVVALLICSVGLYSVMQYFVTQRRREIGVRRALGAPSWRIIGLVFWEGFLAVGIGIGAGTLLTAGTGRLISGVLYGVSPLDSGVITLSAATLLVVCVLASLSPTTRALRVNPTEAMRAQ